MIACLKKREMEVGLEDQVGGLISSPVPICYIDTHVYNSLVKYFEFLLPTLLL